MSLPDAYLSETVKRKRKVARWKLVAGPMIGVVFVAYMAVSDRGSGQDPVPSPRETSLLSMDWTDTTPSINVRHIFHGEFNKRGDSVGFHARPFGEDPHDARVVSIIKSPNSYGVYDALVWIEVEDSDWIRMENLLSFAPSKYRRLKKEQGAFKRSTFFPDRLSAREVVDTILHVVRHRGPCWSTNGAWRCHTDKGFSIEVWWLGKGINTAYPIYQ